MKKLEPLKFTTKPRIIDHLGLAAYSKYTKAIKELIANGYDADATRVNVWFNKGEIVILDDGSGMDEEDIRKEYMAIGSGHKRNAKRTSKFSRLAIGNKGIGKLAGFGIAKIMQIETIKKNKKYTYTLNKEEIDKAERLEDALMDSFNEEDTDEKQGTTIRLTNLLPHIEKITESESNIKQSSKKLREFLATSLPDDSHFEVWVNNKKCTKIDVPYKRKYEIPNDASKLGINFISSTTYDEESKKRIYPKGFIKIVRKSGPNPGVITKVRGSAIGEPKIFNLNVGTHKFVHAALLTGEIEVPEFDPENEKDEIPVIQTDREGFNEDHPKYITYNLFMTEVLKKICRIEERDYNEKRRDEVEARVKDAIKNVKDAFNDYHNDFIKSTGESKTRLKKDKSGTEDIWAGKDKNERKTKKNNPVGINDNSLKEKLKAIKGEGNIRLGNKDYEIKPAQKGVDDPECLIDDDIRVILINTEHPAYDLAVMKKSVEVTLFRIISYTWAYKICKENDLGIEQMYEKIDELVRYYAEWTSNKKRKKKINNLEEETKKQFELNLEIEEEEDKN